MNNCAIVKICKNAREIVNLPAETYKRIEEIASRCDGHKILRVTEILSKAETDMRYSLNAKITLETAVLKCAMPQTDYNLDAILGKINALEARLENAPIKEVVTEKKVVQKPALQTDEGDSPFAETKPEPKPVQPNMWEKPEKVAGGVRSLKEDEKQGVFGKLIRSLRTTRKNAVLFTLCMDLDHTFEGEKLVLLTDSEAVLKSLNRAENSKFISEVLSELGVTGFEVRFKKQGENEYEKALNELKANFNGTDIEIK